MYVLSIAKTIIVYSFPLITLIGLTTNLISFVIFSRKTFENTIFSTYFRFLLLFQTLNLFVPIDKMIELNFSLSFSQISNFTCKLRFVFAYFNYSNAAWFLAIISIDRYLSISFSNRFNFMKRSSVRLFISFFAIGFNSLYYSPTWLFYLKKTQLNLSANETVIRYICKNPGIWFDFMDLFQSVLIPFFIMILFSSFTIKKVFNSRKLIAMNRSILANSKENKSNKNKSSKDVKFSVITIINVISFLLMNLPFAFISIIDDYTNLFENLINLSKFLYSLAFLLIYLNLTSTFFVNYFVNSMFKKEVFDLFKYSNKK